MTDRPDVSLSTCPFLHSPVRPVAHPSVCPCFHPLVRRLVARSVSSSIHSPSCPVAHPSQYTDRYSPIRPVPPSGQSVHTFDRSFCPSTVRAPSVHRVTHEQGVLGLRVPDVLSSLRSFPFHLSYVVKAERHPFCMPHNYIAVEWYPISECNKSASILISVECDKELLETLDIKRFIFFLSQPIIKKM